MTTPLCHIGLLLLGAMWAAQAHPAPQMEAIGTGVMIALAQAKDMLDTGAAARKETSIEIFGAKMSNGMQMGFGDAIQPDFGRRRRRRRHTAANDNVNSLAAAEDYYEDEDEDDDDDDDEDNSSDESSASSMLSIDE